LARSTSYMVMRSEGIVVKKAERRVARILALINRPCRLGGLYARAKATALTPDTDSR
jgi:hypothetical protein